MDPKTQAGWDMWKCAKQTKGNISKSKTSVTCICSGQPAGFPWLEVSPVCPNRRESMRVSQSEQHTRFMSVAISLESSEKHWNGSNPFRFPSLVFRILCIHQLRIFSGQKNQRVALCAGSVRGEQTQISKSSYSSKAKLYIINEKKLTWSL